MSENKKATWNCPSCGIRYIPCITECINSDCSTNRASTETVKPWPIVDNAAGFVYVADEYGHKICTVYGTEDVKMQRAMAIAEIPVLLNTIERLRRGEKA